MNHQELGFMTEVRWSSAIYDSPVGPVVDVATKGKFGGIFRGCAWLMVGGALAIVPGVFVSDAIELLQMQRPGAQVSVCLAIFSFMALVYPFWATAVRRFRAAFETDCYFRAGSGGLSVRLPGKARLLALLLGYTTDEYYLPWAAVKQWYPYSAYGFWGIPFIMERSIIVEMETGGSLHLHTYFFSESNQRIADNIRRASSNPDSLERTGNTLPSA
jgi:hypothetical protein